MATRTQLLARLGSTPFDLLVIGGGIVGAGIARDAVMRGLKVALIDQGDFASGTSSKTSKLIHGGLRYLEQGRLRLVYESLRERQILRTIAPALVHPLTLLLPVYAGDQRSSWKIRTGLWLYDLLAWGRNVRRHRMLSARRTLALEPALRVDGLQAAGLYADCQMDDARLCLANILQAVLFGAVCCNYVRLVRLLKTPRGICGGVGEDALTGRTIDLQATAVINATGPWSDRMRRLSDSYATPRLAPTKGIHVILPRVAEQALFVQGRRDGRLLFVLPWGACSLVGTTESPAGESLETLHATADEVGYLLEEVNRVLPGSHVKERDVVATFAGARPLLASTTSATKASREYRIDVDRYGLISVMGGKFTTYRRMATQVVDLVITRNRWSVDHCLTHEVGLLETIHPVSLDHWREITRHIDPDVLGRLLSWYGDGTFHILQLVDRDGVLANRVCAHHEQIGAELVHAMQEELTCTVTDLLARRTRIAWSPCHGLDALATIGEWLVRYGGWSQQMVSASMEEYRQFIAASVAFRPRKIPPAPRARPRSRPATAQRPSP